MKKDREKWAKLGVYSFCFITMESLFYFFIDRPMSDSVKALDDSHHSLIDIFRGFTDMGKSVWYLWPCGVAALFCGFLSRAQSMPSLYRKLFGYIGVRAFFLFATIALSGIVADIIKPLVGRARPLLWLRDNIYGFHPFTLQGSLWNSFPSGHSTTAFALAASLSIFYPRLRPLWVACALILAISRVMVDAHYLSDVCAGAFLGWLSAALFLKYGMIPVSRVIFPIDRNRAAE
jgi:membrane-associated phospholipid phosphatase